MIDMVENIVIESWQVLGQMAPYLPFGFLIAGALSVCVSPEWVERSSWRRRGRPCAEGFAFRSTAAALFLRGDSGIGFVSPAWRKPRSNNFFFIIHAADRG